MHDGGSQVHALHCYSQASEYNRLRMTWYVMHLVHDGGSQVLALHCYSQASGFDRLRMNC